MTGDVQVDVEAQALRRALAGEAPAREWFEPEFLRRYPLRIVQQTVRRFLDRHGALVGVEREGERWRAVYEQGEEPVIARVGADGRIAGLGIGPAAEAAEIEVPYREWPRSVVRRRMATAMIFPCLAPPVLAASLWATNGVLAWSLVAALGAVVCGGVWLSAPWHLFSRWLRDPLVGVSVLAGTASAVRLPGPSEGGIAWWPVIGLAAVLVLVALRLRDLRAGGSGKPLELTFPVGPGSHRADRRRSTSTPRASPSGPRSTSSPLAGSARAARRRRSTPARSSATSSSTGR